MKKGEWPYRVETVTAMDDATLAAKLNNLHEEGREIVQVSKVLTGTYQIISKAKAKA